MTWFADLTPLTYAGMTIHERSLLAVGWLEGRTPYPRAERVDPTLVADLEERVRRQAAPDAFTTVSEVDRVFEVVEPYPFLGVHGCDLVPCGPDTPLPVVAHPLGPIELGTGQLYLPHPSLNDTLLVAPTLIVHYVRDHGYRPPDAFVEAARRSPPDASPRFRVEATRRRVVWLRMPPERG